MLSRKSFIYIVGVIGLGFILFNNVSQVMDSIKDNVIQFLSLLVALSVSILYGMVNLNRWWTKN